MTMKTLWKAQQSQDPTFAELNQCLHEDWFLLPFEERSSIADTELMTVAPVVKFVESPYPPGPVRDSRLRRWTWAATAMGNSGRKSLMVMDFSSPFSLRTKRLIVE